MLRRGLSAGAVALIVALGGTATAFACDTASITPNASAAPGDTVHWTAAGVLSGAIWKVRLGDGTVLAGPLTSDGSTIHGTFTMPPRVGNAAGVSIELVIDHDDFGEDPQGTKTGWTAYEATPVPAQQTAATPSPTPQQTTADPQVVAQPAAPSTPAGVAPRPHSPPRTHHTTHRVLAGRATPVRAPQHATAPAAVVRTTAVAAAIVPSTSNPSVRRAKTPTAGARPRAVEPASRVHATGRSSQPLVAVADGTVPLRDLLAGGAAVVLLSLLALLWRRRAEPGGAPAVPVPPGPDRFDAIEAELQTLLAEERERERVAVGARDG